MFFIDPTKTALDLWQPVGCSLLSLTHANWLITGIHSLVLPPVMPRFPLSLQEVAAHLVSHLLDRVEAHLARAQPPLAQGSVHKRRRLVTEAVITVPANFSPAARAATIEAGKLAGLTRVELLQGEECKEGG